MTAPWYFRFRGVLFGAIFLAAFPAGYYAEYALTGRADTLCSLAGGAFGAAAAQGVAIAAAALGLAGFAMRVWASSHLSPASVASRDFVAHALVLDGPYRFVRNPLYLGTLLVATGYALIATPVTALFLLAAMWLFVVQLIAVEEAALRKSIGEEYEAYRKRVPRLLPRSLRDFHARPAGIFRESLAFGLAAPLIYFAAEVVTGHGRIDFWKPFFSMFVPALILQVLSRQLERSGKVSPGETR